MNGVCSMTSGRSPLIAPNSAVASPAPPAPSTTRSKLSSSSISGSGSADTRLSPRLPACGLAQRCGRQRVLDAIVDMRAQRFDRRGGVALQGAVEQRPVLNGRLAAAIAERNHLVAEIFVEHQGVG